MLKIVGKVKVKKVQFTIKLKAFKKGIIIQYSYIIYIENINNYKKILFIVLSQIISIMKVILGYYNLILFNKL